MKGLLRSILPAGLYLFAAWPLAGAIAQGAGAERVMLEVGGIDRAAELHRPAGTWPAPQPLLIALHGRGGDGAGMRGWLGFDRVADREGFIVVYADGVDGHWNYGRPINLPMPAVNGAPVDDLAFLTRLIDRLVADGAADPHRIYLVGHSNGGLMAFAAACALADRLAAVAVVLTGMTEHQASDCPPGRPVPMLVLGGTADPLQAFDGAEAPRGRLLSVPETAQFWRIRNECRDRELERLPDLDREDGSTVETVHSRDCRDGAEVLMIRVEGGGHVPPSIAHDRSLSVSRLGPQNRDIETADEVWRFLMRFRR